MLYKTIEDRVYNNQWSYYLLFNLTTLINATWTLERKPVGLQRFNSINRKSITDPPMRFLILSVRFSIQCQYCPDSHFKQISVDAYQLFRTEQRIYTIAFKTHNFIGWQGLRKPFSATDRRRLKQLTWRTHVLLC